MGPTSTHCLFFFNFTEPNWIHNKLAMQVKTSNTEDIEEYQEEKV